MKVAWYGYQRNMLHDERVDPGDPNGATTYALTFMMMMQYASCGGDASRQSELVNDVWPNGHNYGVRQINNAVNTYNQAMQISASDIPDSFEVAYCDAGSGNQNFVMYKNTPQGALKVAKTIQGSGNETFNFRITVGNISGTYSGVTFSNGVAEITLRGGESKTIEGLPSGENYKVVEYAIPAGWASLNDPSGETGQIGEGTTKTVTFTNKRTTGPLRLKKASANTGITG